MPGGGQPAVAQNAVEVETQPELTADVDRTGFPMALGRNPRRIDLDHRRARSRRRSGRRVLLGAIALRAAPAPGERFVGDLAGGPDFEQVALADQCVLDLAGELQPLFARPRAQIAERADRPLARSLGGVDGLHQHVIGVRLALVRPNRFADVHASLCIVDQPSFKRKFKPHLVTISQKCRSGSDPIEQFQRLATTPTSPRAKSDPPRMEVGLGPVCPRRRAGATQAGRPSTKSRPRAGCPMSSPACHDRLSLI